jgi:CHAD domain-containing protein
MESGPPNQRRGRPQAGRRTITRIAKQSLRELSQRFRRLLSDLADVHVEPVETTHQLRVTSRRADVALRLFRAWLPRDRRNGMRRVLKYIRSDAGFVRDLDLLEQQWRPPHGVLAAQVPPAAATWMHKRIQTQRAQARHRLFHWTRKSAVNRFRKRSQQLVRTARLRRHGSANACISRTLGKLVGRLRESLPATSSSLSDSHRTRIDARRLRYAVELLGQILPSSAATIATALSRIQEQLGRINDEATAVRHLKASLDDCGDRTLVPPLQAMLERFESAASARLAQWDADMRDELGTLQNLLAAMSDC